MKLSRGSREILMWCVVQLVARGNCRIYEAVVRPMNGILRFRAGPRCGWICSMLLLESPLSAGGVVVLTRGIYRAHQVRPQRAGTCVQIPHKGVGVIRRATSGDSTRGVCVGSADCADAGRTTIAGVEVRVGVISLKMGFWGHGPDSLRYTRRRVDGPA